MKIPLWQLPMALFQSAAAMISTTLEALFGDEDSLMEMHLQRGKGILGLSLSSQIAHISLTPISFPGSLTEEADGQKALHQDWMEKIPDHRLLFQLTVPGTHDSAACKHPDILLACGCSCASDNYVGEFQEFWNCQVSIICISLCKRRRLIICAECSVVQAARRWDPCIRSQVRLKGWQTSILSWYGIFSFDSWLRKS
jgi:hypothetical protein